MKSNNVGAEHEPRAIQSPGAPRKASSIAAEYPSPRIANLRGPISPRLPLYTSCCCLVCYSWFSFRASTLAFPGRLPRFSDTWRRSRERLS